MAGLRRDPHFVQPLPYLFRRAVHGTDNDCLSALLGLLHKAALEWGLLDTFPDGDGAEGQSQPLLIACLSYAEHALQLAAISGGGGGGGVEALFDHVVLQGMQRCHATARCAAAATMAATTWQLPIRNSLPPHC